MTVQLLIDEEDQHIVAGRSVYLDGKGYPRIWLEGRNVGVHRLDETGGYTGEAVARCQDAKMAQRIAELLTRSAADPNVYYQMAHAGRDLI